MSVVTIAAPAAWVTPLNDWGTWLRAAGRPPTTRYLRDYQVRRFAAAHPHMDPWQVTTDDLVTWLGAQNWKPATRRAYRAALRSFYGWAHAAGRTDHDPAGLLPTVRPERYLPRPAPLDAVSRALQEADDRERLMILLAARQGLRRGEIARVHTDDLQKDLLGWSLRVHGKGGRVRVIPLVDEVARALAGCQRGYVFPGAVDGHLSPAYVGKLISRLLPEHWTAHTLRHRFATQAYAPTRDLLAVQTLLGHASVATTQIYVQQPDDALRDTVRAANGWVA